MDCKYDAPLDLMWQWRFFLRETVIKMYFIAWIMNAGISNIMRFHGITRSQFRSKSMRDNLGYMVVPCIYLGHICIYSYIFNAKLLSWDLFGFLFRTLDESLVLLSHPFSLISLKIMYRTVSRWWKSCAIPWFIKIHQRKTTMNSDTKDKNPFPRLNPLIISNHMTVLTV